MNPNFSNSASLDDSTGRKTLFWFRVYCAVLSVIYILVVGLGIFLAVANVSNNRRDQAGLMVGFIYLIVGVILLFISAVGVFMPTRRWSWIYGLILICLGLTSCCFWPATIPLLIYWLKPETKSLFGR